MANAVAFVDTSQMEKQAKNKDTCLLDCLKSAEDKSVANDTNSELLCHHTQTHAYKNTLDDFIAKYKCDAILVKPNSLAVHFCHLSFY